MGWGFAMRLLATTAIVLALGATGAIAADAPDLIVDDEAIEMAGDWTGAYVGVGVQGVRYLPGPQYEVDGLVHFGFNFQADMFLFGAEAYLGGWLSDIGLSGWIAGGEARVGVLATPEVLVYGALGGHVYDLGAQYWDAGGGVEFMVSENMTVDLEYKHSFPVNTAFNADSVSLSVNWLFN
jgi:opacity protein-like surface antigen